MSQYKSYPEFLPYDAQPDDGMSPYAQHLHRQLAEAEDDDLPRPQPCSTCRSLRRLNCTHVSAKRCVRLRPASKRRVGPVVPQKPEEEDGSSSNLECYDFYACEHVFGQGTHDELVTDASRPRFRGDRGDRRYAGALCPLCWTWACWGERGPARGLRLTVRAPLRLRRERLLRRRRDRREYGEEEEEEEEEEEQQQQQQTDDNSVKRRVRRETKLKMWKVRGLMRGKVQVVLDEELQIRRADKLYKRDYDLY